MSSLQKEEDQLADTRKFAQAAQLSATPEKSEAASPLYTAPPTVASLIDQHNHGGAKPDQILSYFLDRRDLLAPILNCLIWTPPRDSFSNVGVWNSADTIVPGTLHGVPFVVKDCIHVAGLPTTGGMSTSMIDHVVPEQDAPVIAALKHAGAICIGKANLPDLHLGLSTDSSSFGRVKNPWRLALNAIGSSGGVAAAVSAGVAPFGIGTDTGGCLRIPAAMCGVCGFRPSFERYSNLGMLHQSITRDTPGPIARTVEDIQIIDKVLATTCPREKKQPGMVARGIEKLTGKLPMGDRIYPSDFKAASLAGLRIGICKNHYFEDLDSQVSRAMDILLAHLKKLGAVIVDAAFLSDHEPWKLDALVGEPIRRFEILREVSRYLYENKCKTTVADIVDHFPGTQRDKEMLQAAMSGDESLGAISPTTYRDALMIHRVRLQASFEDFFRRHNVQVFLYPTTPLPVKVLNENGTVNHNGRDLPTYPTYTKFTAPTTNAGQPAISMPCGCSDDGLPIGVELTALRGQDAELLEIARAIFESIPRTPAPAL